MLPEGWERSIRSFEMAPMPPYPCVTYISPGLQVSAGREQVTAWTDECDEHDIISERDLDSLISILRRAFRQHLHLKANPNGPPLTEEEENEAEKDAAYAEPGDFRTWPRQRRLASEHAAAVGWRHGSGDTGASGGLSFRLPDTFQSGVAVYVDGKLYSAMTGQGHPLPPETLRPRDPEPEHPPGLSIESVVQCDLEHSPLTMAHACACAVCEFCAMGSYTLSRIEGSGSFVHTTPSNPSGSAHCKASAIHAMLAGRRGE